MDIFNCTKEELAKHLAEDTDLYNQSTDLIRKLKRKGVLSPEIDGSLEETLSLLEEANKIATDSKYFVFNTDDTYTESEGYTLYQKVNGELVQSLGLTEHGPRTVREIADFLKKRNIKEVFTVNIPYEGGYCGLDKDEDGGDDDVISHSIVDNQGIKDFEKKDIKIIFLKP